MLGKLHDTSFPEETFNVKDRFSLSSKREESNAASCSYRYLHRQPVTLANDSLRNIFIFKSIHYVRFSIVDDGPQRTSNHSHSMVAGGLLDTS